MTSCEDTSPEVIRKFIEDSDVCLGFLPKKGNASVKSMLKVYKLEEHYAQHMKCPKLTEEMVHCEGAGFNGINTIAYLSRLELYVPEKQWKAASMFTKGALTSMINQLEDRMASVLLEWNKHRSSAQSDD